MATLRGRNSKFFVGEKPPQVLWTIVRGDTSAFKVYVTDDNKQPLYLEDWTIQMEIKRPSTPGVITDNAVRVLTLTPVHDANDLDGEFTVSLQSVQSMTLQTGDIFDIELSLPQDQIVWTVCQGTIEVVEDVTA